MISKIANDISNGRIDQLFKKANTTGAETAYQFPYGLDSLTRGIFSRHLHSQYIKKGLLALVTSMRDCPYRQERCWRNEGREDVFKCWIRDSLLEHAESLKGFFCERFSITHHL